MSIWTVCVFPNTTCRNVWGVGVIYLFLIDHSHAVAASCMMDAERNGAYSRSACPLQFFDHIWDFASPYYYILNRWVGHLLTFLYDAFLLLRMNFFREYTPLVPRSGAGSRTWQHWLIINHLFHYCAQNRSHRCLTYWMSQPCHNRQIPIGSNE